ncbi:predicted protein [Postia placenta Mad-698-R]|uniref:Major facilitator superfamily (MFS) profile domain-containing protein n=1 Tax=Postia placenta MAD-698-R-SB12 TaxID=670580 RepID=A0A1X6N343_9APHY|nr:hypothetical protein POSPLADRAFT_1046370 [Postia placenta MAD-698-R-SB12]EED79616.1 predicted protein [Postia placenta Mad-698-R]OSX63024.1 hypothetical protein POSPLADRAFT_1046370 [Postia placenta MAD-698-R-SB12]
MSIDADPSAPKGLIDTKEVGANPTRSPPAQESTDNAAYREDVKVDGGLWAWLSVAGGWMILFCTFGYANSFGVYQDYYTLEHSSSSSNISWIGSLQLVLSQGVGLGVGSGMLLVPAQTVQSHHWEKRRSLAMGIVATGSGFGGIIYPIMLNRLIHGPLGFAWGLAIMNAGSIPGRVIMNAMATNLGLFNMLIIVIVAMGALTFALFGVLSPGAVIAFSILYGFFSGAFLSLSAPAILGMAKNVDEAGMSLGLAYFISSFAFLTGAPIDGALLGNVNDPRWYRPTVFSGAVLMVGAVFFTSARFLLVKRRGTNYV